MYYAYLFFSFLINGNDYCLSYNHLSMNLGNLWYLVCYSGLTNWIFYFLSLVGWLVIGMRQYKIEIQWQVKKTNF